METKHLNRQVNRNILRFPKEFMFQITIEERHQPVTICHRFKTMKHSGSLPYAFTGSFYPWRGGQKIEFHLTRQPRNSGHGAQHLMMIACTVPIRLFICRHMFYICNINSPCLTRRQAGRGRTTQSF